MQEPRKFTIYHWKRRKKKERECRGGQVAEIPSHGHRDPRHHQICYGSVVRSPRLRPRWYTRPSASTGKFASLGSPMVLVASPLCAFCVANDNIDIAGRTPSRFKIFIIGNQEAREKKGRGRNFAFHFHRVDTHHQNEARWNPVRLQVMPLLNNEINNSADMGNEQSLPPWML